ncbi:MAG TPA: hydrogenase maturation nickel metallochaperone HypA [Terriglobales bacterium]|nr:hydrogenase maturation nickel metallochaperone HypA [Terriglobales bacterium]
MHELSVAAALLEGVREQLARRPSAQLRKIGIRLGELSAVDPEALRFAFEVLTRDSELPEAELQIEICPRRHRCSACGFEFTVHDYDWQCPQCSSLDTHCIAGEELELSFLEVEEHGPSAVPAENSERK